MTVDYNNFAKTFAKSRKNMKWAELEYFFSLLKSDESLLDIGCGSGRLLQQYKIYFWDFPKEYIWIDLSDRLLDEARSIYSTSEFICWNMLDVKKTLQSKTFNAVFMIASFHHLSGISEREKLLTDLYNILPTWWKIYMTNWALNSPLNYDKYLAGLISWSENNFWSTDYSIKIGQDSRYYHCFTLKELEFLSQKVWFAVLENRLFLWERNYITILEK